MTCNVTAAQFAAYLDKTSAELVDHVGTCGACQQRLEGSAPPTDGVVEGTMRAVQADWMAKEIGQLVFDVAARYASALAVYSGRST